MSDTRALEQEAADLIAQLKRPDDWQWAKYRDNETGGEYESHEAMARDFAKAVSFGDLSMWGVSIPIADDPDGHTHLIICHTGNGPTSEVHARFLAGAPRVTRQFLDTIDSLRTEVRNLRRIAAEAEKRGAERMRERVRGALLASYAEALGMDGRTVLTAFDAAVRALPTDTGDDER